MGNPETACWSVVSSNNVMFIGTTTGVVVQCNPATKQIISSAGLHQSNIYSIVTRM